MQVKNTVIPIIITIVGICISCLVMYLILPQRIKWLLTSAVDVPACAAQVADRLGIERDVIAVKDYMFKSLKPGMTSEEVEETLSKFGRIVVVDSSPSIADEHGTNMEVWVRFCDNPAGHYVLLLYYTEDGYLINVVDPDDN